MIKTKIYGDERYPIYTVDHRWGLEVEISMKDYEEFLACELLYNQSQDKLEKLYNKAREENGGKRFS